jgi:hypothetical protein
MGQTSNQIEQHIQETRNDLSDNFSELEAKVNSAVDWRAQFDERPWTLMAVAFGGGLLLSALFPARRSSRRTRWDVPGGPDASSARPGSQRISGQDVVEPSATWGALKGALIGMATSKVSDMVEELVPGFKQELTKDQTNRSYDRSSQQTLHRTAGAGSN